MTLVTRSNNNNFIPDNEPIKYINFHDSHDEESITTNKTIDSTSSLKFYLPELRVVPSMECIPPTNDDLDIYWYNVVDIYAVRLRSSFIHEGFYKYDIVQEEAFDSNSVMSVDFDTIDIPNSSFKFLCNVGSIHSDSKMIMVTLTTGLYPSLHPPQVFSRQATSFLYPSSTSSLKLSMGMSLLFQQPQVVITVLMLFMKLSSSSVSFRYGIPFSYHNPKGTGDGTGQFQLQFRLFQLQFRLQLQLHL